MARLPGQQKALGYRKRKFAQELVKNGGDERAAIEKSHGHLAPSTKNNYIYQFRHDPDVQRYVNHIAEAIPDDLLIEKHTALLEKTDEDGTVNVAAVKAGLDMAYKLKGSYAAEKHINFNANLQDFTEATDEQLMALIQEDAEETEISEETTESEEGSPEEPVQPAERELSQGEAS